KSNKDMAEITIKPRFKMADVRKHINDYKDQIYDHVVEVLKSLADSTAESARKNAEFLNHTFNLRSSLGTVVFRDGVIAHRNFKDVGGDDGYNKAISVAEANIPSDGVGMVLAAGEDYALYVEAKHNKWLMSGSSDELALALQKLI